MDDNLPPGVSSKDIDFQMGEIDISGILEDEVDMDDDSSDNDDDLQDIVV